MNSLPQCRIFRARLFFSWHALLLITIKDLARNENPKPVSMLVTVFGYANQRVRLKDYILGGVPESVRWVNLQEEDHQNSKHFGD
jgi:hypothetical protein